MGGVCCCVLPKCLRTISIIFQFATSSMLSYRSEIIIITAIHVTYHHNHNIITIYYSITIFISLLSSSTIQQFFILDFTAKMMIFCDAITAHLRCKRLLFHGIGFDQSAEYLIIIPCFLKLLRQPTSNVHHGSRYINNYNIDFNKTLFFFFLTF